MPTDGAYSYYIEFIWKHFKIENAIPHSPYLYIDSDCVRTSYVIVDYEAVTRVINENS